MAARDSNAMSNLQYRLLGGEQVLPLPGAEQTTSLLVVMILYKKTETAPLQKAVSGVKFKYAKPNFTL